MNMICSVIFQPWASLIFVRAKPWEFRKDDYRERRFLKPKPGERIAIAAAARKMKPAEIDDLLERLDDEQCTTGLVSTAARPLLERCRFYLSRDRLRDYVCPISYGMILGTVEIGAPVLSEQAMPKWKGTIGDSDRLEHCKWAWPMLNPILFRVPVPVRGQQGFFRCVIPAEAA